MNSMVFMVLLAVAGGILQNRDRIKDWFNPPPPIPQLTANEEVILYSTTWCGYCAKTRKYFAENHIPYTDLDVELSEKGRADYLRLGVHGIPVVVINNDTPIHGYNPDMLGQALRHRKTQNASGVDD